VPIQSEHVALIGDHKQLPPIITSPDASKNGLEISLFERLTEERSELFFLSVIELRRTYCRHK
jgi:superfamily I DNA and/or RNA helicase